jgi:cytoplasmic iron level regulating protein YaaA (DUF328/UPF0246 family)
MIVLINSSKTMRAVPGSAGAQRPALLECAQRLDMLLKAKSEAELKSLMHLSPKLAASTHALIERWSADPGQQTPAIDAFQGDIFRGLRANTLTADDRAYANDVLRIMSGLYGILRPLDGITPYRLELMYPLSGDEFRNLYEFWGSAVAETLPADGLIVDAASDEYARLVRPFVDADRIVEPQFLTQMSADQEPTFVVVHAKVARGAYARWLITSRITDPARFGEFADLDWVYDPETSTPEKPVYIKRLAG